MIKKWVQVILICLVILMCATVVTAFPYRSLPILTGLVIGSTSDPGISSSLSLSTSTSIISSGTSGTTQSGSPSGSSSNILKAEIPEQWQPGVREGVYYDPLSKTSWIYDRILKKYYCPEKGWLLIGEYTTGSTPRLIRQFYYDPADVVFISMKNGEKIQVNQNGIYDPTSISPSVTPKPVVQPQQTGSTTILMSPEPVASGSSSQQTADPCLVQCSECPGGTCRDCNQNGICDDSEGATVTPTPTGGMSESAQSGILFKKDL
ncbi:hypothetical protein [uncultured Methanospirillum sp.]|uniref:hypothetical protein n=1 Tax=uncultured Methanospirillum sp. TaxID=262503 RepID=UPI0029C82FC5|nr:hypothetical protein [uncultured Methanospirillum sp.]